MNKSNHSYDGITASTHLSMISFLTAANYEIASCNQQIVFVKADSDDSPCPVEQPVLRQPLNYYVVNISAWFTSNTVMFLLVLF